jgi:hypothetical protein
MIAVLHAFWMWGGYVAIVLVAALAFWRGGWAERSGAAVISCAWFLTPVFQQHYNPGVAGIVIDGVTALALLVISERSRRIWTLLASSSMWAAMLCHLGAAGYLHVRIGYFAYVTALGLFGGWYLLICLVLGVLEHQYLSRRDAEPAK